MYNNEIMNHYGIVIPFCLPFISCLAGSMTYNITVRKLSGPIIYYFGVVSSMDQAGLMGN